VPVQDRCFRGVDKNWYSRRNLAKFIQLSESGGPNSYLSAIEEMQFWNCFTAKGSISWHKIQVKWR
jgi:hypothetical protein